MPARGLNVGMWAPVLRHPLRSLRSWASRFYKGIVQINICITLNQTVFIILAPKFVWLCKPTSEDNLLTRPPSWNHRCESSCSMGHLVSPTHLGERGGWGTGECPERTLKGRNGKGT